MASAFACSSGIEDKKSQLFDKILKRWLDYSTP